MVKRIFGRRKAISIVLLFLLIASIIPMAVSADSVNTENERLAGNDRYATSYKVAEALAKKVGSFDNVVVACGGNFPDALAGGYLSKEVSAPILLVNKENEPKVKSLIMSKMKPNGTVYILGGVGVVSKSFADSLKSSGRAVNRLSGNDRYATNLEILKKVVKPGDELLVATGRNYADSLSGSSIGKAMLLVDNTLTAEQKNWISKTGISKFYILGGEGAVSKNIANTLRQYANVERIGGSNRYETSYKIAKKFFSGAKQVALVSGKNFPDGLSGAPLAMVNNAPIILVADGSTDYARDFVKENNVTNSVTIGGEGAVSKNAVASTLVGATEWGDYEFTSLDSNISYYISGSHTVKDIKVTKTKIQGKDYAEVSIKWDRNDTVYDTLIASFSSNPINKSQVEDMLKEMPNRWKSQIEPSTYLQSESRSGFPREEIKANEPVFVLLLNMDSKFNPVGYIIVRAKKIM